ncbi:MAG: hypothetical protein WBE13_04500 [Candidatus Acidiferrum sp.]
MNAQTEINIQTSPNAGSAINEPAETEEQTATSPQTAQSVPSQDSSPQDSSRCQHRFVNRTRCRHLASPSNPRFCPRHARLPENLQPDDLTAELSATLDDLDGLDGIYEFLAKLAILLAQNRVSTRRAAVLAYITNQLLRTFAAIRREEAAAPTQIIFDAPRPIRD